MKILFLAHRTPYPPNKGDKIRSFHLLSQLAKSHDVTLVYWVDDPRDFGHTGVLRSLCRGRVFPVQLHGPSAALRALVALLRGQSFSEGYYGAQAFKGAVEHALRDGPFDAVFVFSSAMASYARQLDSRVKIVDFVDVDSDKWRQLAEHALFPLSALYRLERRRLARCEAAISGWATASLFVSAADAELFRNQGGRGNIVVLPNGVDLELRRLPLDPSALGGGAKALASAKLIFVGTMNYYPNVDAVKYFAQAIFPLIRREIPRAVFEIVGRHPVKAVRRLAAIEGVRVVGEVENVRSRLVQADVSVAPMRIARGVPNKVLEAMGMGVPVVATPAAIQGIEVSDGQEVLTGKTAGEFAARVLMLLRDAELRKTITKKAWTKMKQLYNWEVTGAKLEKLLSVPPQPSEANSAQATGGTSGQRR